MSLWILVAQLMVFLRMVFSDFSVKEEFLTLLPLKTRTRGADIYDAVEKYFMDKNMPFEKLVSVTTDGAPAMTDQPTGFVYAEETQIFQSFYITTAYTSRQCAPK